MSCSMNSVISATMTTVRHSMPCLNACALTGSPALPFCPVSPVHPDPSIHPFPSARLSKRNSGHIIRHDLFCSRLLFDAFCFHPSVCSCFLYFYFLNLLAVNDRHVRTAFIIGPIAMESFFNDSRGMSVQQCRLSAKDRQTPPPESSPEAFSYISWTRNFMYSTRH